MVSHPGSRSSEERGGTPRVINLGHILGRFE